jgi:hypothetical protein
VNPKPRYITKPGATCACKDCGAALELSCPNGHNPGQYILSEDPQDAAARAPAPKGREPGRKRVQRKPRPNPDRAPRFSTCRKCEREFQQAWTGKPAKDCRPCRGMKVAA